MLQRAVFTFCLLLLLPLPARAAPPEEVRLTFKRIQPEPALARFSKEDARAFVAAMEAEFRFPAGVVTSGLLFGSPTDMRLSDLERMLRAAYAELYGPSSMPRPHPEAYHREVFGRLRDAVSTCHIQLECKRKLIEALDELAGDICKPGSKLNKLLTKK